MGNAPRRVAVFGSAHVDVIVSVGELPRPGETVLAQRRRDGYGGKGANQAVAAATGGANVAFVGLVGDDDAGDDVRANLEAHGLDVSFVRTAPGARTGVALVAVDGGGRNQIIVDMGAGAGFGAPLVDDAATTLRVGDVVVVQCEIPASAVERVVLKSRDKGAIVVLNLAPFVPLRREVLRAASLLVVNESEARSLLDDPAAAPEQLAAIGARRMGTGVIVTLGEHGSVFASPTGESQHISAFPVSRVVDTTGAGDVYIGTLAAQLAGGLTVGDAMAGAARAAAHSVTHPGARTSPL